MPTVTVTQAKLVMNAFAAIFQNELQTADLVTWKEYDQEMNDRNGLQVVEQIAPRYNVYETTDGVKDLSAGVDDSAFGSEIFKVNKTFNANMGWGDFVKIRDVGAARESEALKSAATRLAEYIDAYVLEEAILAANNWVGTPGQDIDDVDELMSAYTRLKEEGVNDAELRAVLNFTDKQKLGDQVLNLAGPGDEAAKALRMGFKGNVGGIPTTFTQQLPTLTLGTRADAAVNGAAQDVNYADVCTSTAPGRYMTQTLVIDSAGAAGATIKAGEVFTIAGVNAWDNRLGASLGRLQQFTVVADTTTSGAGEDATVTIFPAIIVQGSGVNNAHATVDAAPADNAVVTFLGTASTAYKPRAIIQKRAVVVNTAPLVMPATGVGMRRKLQKIPISVRMWQHSDFDTGAHNVRFDVALTANIRDRRRICRVNGTA